MIINPGDRVIGPTTVARPGRPSLMITLQRDAAGLWYLDYNGTDWSK